MNYIRPDVGAARGLISDEGLGHGSPIVLRGRRALARSATNPAIGRSGLYADPSARYRTDHSLQRDAWSAGGASGQANAHGFDWRIPANLSRHSHSRVVVSQWFAGGHHRFGAGVAIERRHRRVGGAYLSADS